jgi:hypothetical protein
MNGGDPGNEIIWGEMRGFLVINRKTHSQLEWFDRVSDEACELWLGVLYEQPREHREAGLFADIFFGHRFRLTCGHFHFDAMLPILNSGRCPVPGHKIAEVRREEVVWRKEYRFLELSGAGGGEDREGS